MRWQAILPALGKTKKSISIRHVPKEDTVSPIKIFHAAALGLAALVLAPAVQAQAPAVSGTKVGVINLQQAVIATEEGKQAGADLQAQFAPRQQELTSLNSEISELQQRLNGTPTLSEEEQARLNAQGTRLEQRLERKNTEFQEDFTAAQADAVNSIGRKMLDVVRRFAQDGNFALILDSSTQNTPVLASSKNIDITQNIVRLYDQAYPAKGGRTAPATKSTPSSKPSTPPATRPQ